MRDSIKIIKFTAVMSILFLALTYFVTVNIETHIIAPNTVWLSNNFALTIFGGIFASMLVVLICEVQKYRITRVSVENDMFWHASYLYWLMFLMQQNIHDYLENTEANIPADLLEQSTLNIRNELFVLRNVNYASFKQKNLILVTHQKFLTEIAYDIQSLVDSSSKELQIAINNVKIDYLQQNLINRKITSRDELIQRVLSYQYNDVSEVLDKIDEYLNDVDKYCKSRYNWQEMREKIHSSYKNTFEVYDFNKKFQKEN